MMFIKKNNKRGMAEEKLSQIFLCSFLKHSLDAFYVNY